MHIKKMLINFIYTENGLIDDCRVMFWLYKKGCKRLAAMMKSRIFRKYACCISDKVFIDRSCSFPHPVGIVIGEGVRIGSACTIYQNVTIGQNDNSYPKIGSKVVIYPNSVIIGNIIVGNNVVIGAGSVVTHSIPDDAVVAGCPARIIRFLDKNDGS